MSEKKQGRLPEPEETIKKLEEIHGHFRALAGIAQTKQGRAGHLESAGIIADAIALLKAQNAFVEYFAGLYGKGLEVANWHLNGTMEPLDNFYESAMEEYENA